jgi:hypothetical protein
VAGALIVGLAVAADNHSSQKVDSPMAEMMKTAEDLAEMIRESERRCGAKSKHPRVLNALRRSSTYWTEQ